MRFISSEIRPLTVEMILRSLPMRELLGILLLRQRIPRSSAPSFSCLNLCYLQYLYFSIAQWGLSSHAVIIEQHFFYSSICNVMYNFSYWTELYKYIILQIPVLNAFHRYLTFKYYALASASMGGGTRKSA